MRTHFARLHGFTLLELSIVLTLIAVIMGGGLVVFTAGVQTSQFNATAARLDAIDKAMLNYTVANSRIPCPSNITNVVGSTNFGIEAANPGSCTGGTPAATNTATSGTVEGGVPTRALRLSDDYAFDGWGHAIRYAADPAYTIAGTLPLGASCTLTPPVSSSAITVYDSTGTNARTTSGVYALISSGANGHGAYTSAGVMMTSGSDNANELVNCHCNSSAATTTYTPKYVQQAPTLDGSDASDNFDDIVNYKDAWQMQAANYPLSGAAQCFVYVVDTGNSRVQTYTSNTAYYGQFTITKSGSHTIYAAVDSAGNIWLSNLANSFQVFNAAGSMQQQYGTSGTGYGNFSAPEGIAFDTNGAMWVADNGNNRVQKCTTSGATLTCTTAAGAGYNSVTGTIGASGSGAGQLNGPTAIAVDRLNNLWVVDYGNTRVNEYTSLGSFVTSFTLTAAPMGIATDSGGNVWVTVTGATIVIYNSTGTLLNTYTSSGTGNGQFSGIGAMAIDSSQNLWVVDGSNNRVQEFTKAPTYVGQFGPASGAQQFNTIGGIAVGGR